MIEPCNLFKIIPEEKLRTYFDIIESASAELDLSFLGFEDCYEEALKYANEDTIIIDFGFGYALQSWYFQNCKQYIGIDAWVDKNLFQAQEEGCFPENVTFLHQTIQDYISDLLKSYCDLNNVIAICSAVPDKEARQLIRDTFPSYIDWYPGEKMTAYITNPRVFTK